METLIRMLIRHPRLCFISSCKMLLVVRFSVILLNNMDSIIIKNEYSIQRGFYCNFLLLENAKCINFP